MSPCLFLYALHIYRIDSSPSNEQFTSLLASRCQYYWLCSEYDERTSAPGNFCSYNFDCDRSYFHCLERTKFCTISSGQDSHGVVCFLYVSKVFVDIDWFSADFKLLKLGAFILFLRVILSTITRQCLAWKISLASYGRNMPSLILDT